MHRTATRLRRLAGIVVLGLVSAACAAGASAGTGGSGQLSIRILSPVGGSSASEPFAVKLASSVPLGDPSTGEHHVHLCFDGTSCDAEYRLVYGSTFVVSGLSAGRHTIEASLRNADHTDAGPRTMITVIVAGGATGSGGPTPGGGPIGGGYGG